MKTEWKTQKTLLMRIQDKNDQDAWDDFVHYYKSFIKKILNYLKVSQNDQEDLTQDILLKIWKSLHQMDYNPERARFRTWLNTVIRNSCYDFFRKNKREKNVKMMTDSQIEEDTLVLNNEELEAVIDKEWKVHVTNLALSNLEKVFSGNAIEVFKLTLQGHSNEEVAEKLHIAKHSIYTLRKRVEKKLIEEVARLKTDMEFQS